MKALTFQSTDHILSLCSIAVVLAFTNVTGFAATYPDTILSDHPVAYYRLEELPGATVAADSSSNGLDGTYVQNTAGTYPILGLPGIDTNSVQFNGGSDHGSVQI